MAHFVLRGLICALLVTFIVADTVDVCGSNGDDIAVTETVLSGYLTDIQWAGDGYTTVWVRTNDGHIYLSQDEGQSWADQSTNLKSASGGSSYVYDMYTTADENKMIMQGRTNNHDLWTSSLRGSSIGYTYHNTGLYILYLLPHPTNANKILAVTRSNECYTSSTGCRNQLYLSNNLGSSWSLILDYVVRAAWGNDTTHDTVFAVFYPNGNGKNQAQLDMYTLQWALSTNSFKDHTVKLEHAVDFLYYNNILFVAQLVEPDSYNLALQVSADNGNRFTKAQFPAELDENRYTILDATEGNAFVNVDQSDDGSWGHTYASASFTDDRFGAVLLYTARTLYGAVDFARILGLDGIYIANYLNVDDEGKQTVITYDKGGSWQLLEAPSVDSVGQPTNCAFPMCSLNLFGRTQSLYGRFYSTNTAIGLIISTGNTGQYLQTRIDEINTYFSRDAGWTWNEVRKGAYIYEFGDYGGLVVMAYEEEATTSMVYSWDQGASWVECNFTQQPIEVQNIVVEPTSTSLNFLLYGTRHSGNNVVGVLASLNFTNLHQRECLEGDYEDFSPSDVNGGNCLLGQQYVYERRKQFADCANPNGYESGHVVQACACTREDFECDYCYQEKNEINGTTCVVDPTCTGLADLKKPPSPCKDYYYVSQGYRLVNGDGCAVADDKLLKNILPIKTRCPGYHGDSSPNRTAGYVGIALLVVLVVLGAVGVALCILSRKNEKVRSALQRLLPGFLSRGGSDSRGASYSRLGGNAPESVVDEELDEAPEVLDDSAISNYTSFSEAIRSGVATTAPVVTPTTADPSSVGDSSNPPATAEINLL